MTMNRVIHAAVRRDLTRLESALDAAPDGDRARARQLATAYANLHRELKHHHEGEDNNVFPFLARVEGATELVQVMEAEHQAMSDALGQPIVSAAELLLSQLGKDQALAARKARS